MSKNECLYVVYSSDDNYSKYMGISILSLLENNKKFKNIEIFIIENNISLENKQKLEEIFKNYNCKYQYIKLDKYKKQLNLEKECELSISSYGRLFLGDMLPEYVNKVIYFDCDSVIEDNLNFLWDMDIDDYYVAGVIDTVFERSKISIGIKSNEIYINAGMLLINLKKWREENIQEEFINFINKHKGKVSHHDQGVINGVLHKKIKILQPKYNLMTVFYTMKRKDIMKFYNIKYSYYSEEEIKQSLEKPVYIHYTPGFTTRPWVKGCKHPRIDLYQKYLNMSPWNNLKPIKDNSKIQVKFVNFIYNNLPFNMADKFYKGIMNIVKGS